MSVPNVAGFIDAQAGLRSEMGAQVTFHVPIEPTWPPGTKINPITDLPYDATIKPTSAHYKDVVKTCLLILKQASPLRPQANTDVTAAGEMSGMDIIIDMAYEDYAEIKTADRMVVNGLTYEIRETKPFSLANKPYRYLLYGQET